MFQILKWLSKIFYASLFILIFIGEYPCSGEEGFSLGPFLVSVQIKIKKLNKEMPLGNLFSTFFFTKPFKQGVDLSRMNFTFFHLFSQRMQKIKIIATLLCFRFMG